MVGEDDVCAVADKQIAFDGDAQTFQRPNLFQQRRWVDYQAVADDALLAANETRGDQRQDKLLIANLDRVACIVASRRARHDVESIRY